MSDDHSINLSEDEDETEPEYQGPDVSGRLQKWTNYIHGWQDRYIVLKDGTLCYYKSENETSFGCRGAVSINKATVRVSEFNFCNYHWW